MKKAKCIIAVVLLVAAMSSIIFAPTTVNAEEVDGTIVEPRYPAIRCVICESGAIYIRDIVEAGIRYSEFYCKNCKNFFYLEK